MKKILTSILIFCATTLNVVAQNDFNQIDESGTITTANQRRNNKTDTLGTGKEIPKGIKVDGGLQIWRQASGQNWTRFRTCLWTPSSLRYARWIQHDG